MARSGGPCRHPCRPLVCRHRTNDLNRATHYATAAAETPTIAGLAVREQAKGRLSMQLGVDPDSALGYLRRYAVGRQVSLQTGAVRVATGHLRRPLTNP
jgi:hypothetical protein